MAKLVHGGYTESEVRAMGYVKFDELGENQKRQAFDQAAWIHQGCPKDAIDYWGTKEESPEFTKKIMAEVSIGWFEPRWGGRLS